MKRFIITLLLLSLLSILFISCNVDYGPISTETSLDETATEEETIVFHADTTAPIETDFIEIESIETNKPQETELPERDLVLYASDQVLAEKFNFDDSSTFEATVKDQGYRYYVFYRLMIQGVSTDECYLIYLDKSYNLLEAKSYEQGEYSKYLSDEEFLQALEAAIARLDEQTAPYTSAPHYILREEQGYLCLYVEEIVDNSTGHEHIFSSEKICPIS